MLHHVIEPMPTMPTPDAPRPIAPTSTASARDAQRWTEVLARDRAADGRFFYAVTSTGVFCRPSCPSRRPRRENVRFFETPAQAAEAGFRACKRCRPTETVAAPLEAAIRRVASYLDAHA